MPVRLSCRVRSLEARLPPAPRADIPGDPEALARGLLTGALRPADLDRRNPEHVSLMATLAARLTRRLGEQRTTTGEGPR